MYTQLLANHTAACSMHKSCTVRFLGHHFLFTSSDTFSHKTANG